MKAYYAHPITTYGSKIESDDMALLTALGFEVVNPNHPDHDECYRKWGIGYFEDLVQTCQLLAFRAFPDSSIPSGIAVELRAARHARMPVLELPTGIQRRSLTVEHTREFLLQAGRSP